MISVADARKILSSHTIKLSHKKVPLLEALNCVLAEEVKARCDQPQAHNAAMDGIAVSFSSLERNCRAFKIIGEQRPGQPLVKLDSPEECYQIYTGGIIPLGCQCVIPVEDIDLNDDKAYLREGVCFKEGQFIRRKGQDYHAGDLLIRKGEVITPAKVSVLASAGFSEVSIVKPPKIALISTGDELVDIDEPCASHQVRLSNVYTINALLKEANFPQVTLFKVHDDRTAIARLFCEASLNFDILISVGGVSMGKFDFIPGILKELGFKIVFHKITERPGKPLLFAFSSDGKPFFGLPGNPVSSHICTHHYLIPFLEKSSGKDQRPKEFALLESKFVKEHRLTYFLPVAVTNDNSVLKAGFVNYSGSGDYLAMAKSDGYVELSIEKNEFAKGDIVPLHRWSRI